MSRIRFTSTKIFKQSIFGAFFTLWTAPIDGPKLDIYPVKKPAKFTNNWFFDNLIVGHKS